MPPEVPTIAASHSTGPEIDRTPSTDRFEALMLITDDVRRGVWHEHEISRGPSGHRIWRQPGHVHAREIEVEAAVVALAEEASFSAAAMNSVN